MVWMIASLFAYFGSSALTLWLIRRHLLQMRAEVAELAAEMLRESLRQAPHQALDKATQMAGAFVDRIGQTNPRTSSESDPSDTQQESNSGPLKNLLSLSQSAINSTASVLRSQREPR